MLESRAHASRRHQEVLRHTGVGQGATAYQGGDDRPGTEMAEYPDELHVAIDGDLEGVTTAMEPPALPACDPVMHPVVHNTHPSSPAGTVGSQLGQAQAARRGVYRTHIETGPTWQGAPLPEHTWAALHNTVAAAIANPDWTLGPGDDDEAEKRARSSLADALRVNVAELQRSSTRLRIAWRDGSSTEVQRRDALDSAREWMRLCMRAWRECTDGVRAGAAAFEQRSSRGECRLRVQWTARTADLWDETWRARAILAWMRLVRTRHVTGIRKRRGHFVHYHAEVRWQAVRGVDLDALSRGARAEHRDERRQAQQRGAESQQREQPRLQNQLAATDTAEQPQQAQPQQAQQSPAAIFSNAAHVAPDQQRACSVDDALSNRVEEHDHVNAAAQQIIQQAPVQHTHIRWLQFSKAPSMLHQASNGRAPRKISRAARPGGAVHVPPCGVWLLRAATAARRRHTRHIIFPTVMPTVTPTVSARFWDTWRASRTTCQRPTPHARARPTH